MYLIDVFKCKAKKLLLKRGANTISADGMASMSEWERMLEVWRRCMK